MGMKNSREPDCNGLTMLIHPGLVQVHQATKIRNSKSVCLFLLSLTISSIVFLYFVPDRSQFSWVVAAANQRALKSLFLPVDFSPCSDLKSTGYQGGWKPLLLPCRSTVVNRKIFACFFGLLLCSLLHGCSKATSTASQCSKMSI